MIYKILVEQDGKFVDTGETVECEFEETQAVIDELQLERGCCCALEVVSE
jgi:DNA-directed RNA polymerase subunit N (RpoN/RPB10)